MQQAQRHYTIEEYLVVEAMSPVRNEYFDGEILAMAGGTTIGSPETFFWRSSRSFVRVAANRWDRTLESSQPPDFIRTPTRS